MGWMYTLFFVLLGVSAAVWGGWLERVGPRNAGVISAMCLDEQLRSADHPFARRPVHPLVMLELAA
jgi:MFS family permease